VVTTCNLPLSETSHAQPDPNCAAPFATNSFFSQSRPPKAESIACSRAPPALEGLGAIDSQKNA
jgi:hypothetical protein